MTITLIRLIFTSSKTREFFLDLFLRVKILKNFAWIYFAIWRNFTENAQLLINWIYFRELQSFRKQTILHVFTR